MGSREALFAADPLDVPGGGLFQKMVTTMEIQRGEPADPKDAFRPGPLFRSEVSPVAKVIPHRGGRYGVFSAAGFLLGSFDDFDSAALACRAWPQAVCVHSLGTAELRR